MKKAILSLLVFFFALSLFGTEPIIKFYLNDGSTKEYKIADLEEINFIKADTKNVLHIYYSDSLISYYPVEIIEKLKIEQDSTKNELLNVFIFTYPKSYILSDIDSIIFKVDIYQPLTIGTQVWMLKNLNVDHYRNGDSIPEVRDSVQWRDLTTGAWCHYNNDSSIGKIYNNLYNWYAVNDPRGLAPYGWHVPSDSEWTTLTNFLGGDSIAGGKLKEAGTKHCLSPNTGATNESGFSALPGGLCYPPGAYNYINYEGYFWLAPAKYTSDQRYLRLAGYNEYLYKNTWFGKGLNYGHSVRCLKD